MQFVKSVFEAFVELNALISSFERIIEMLRGMKEDMHLNGIKCDMCDNIHNKNIHQYPLPKEWIILHQNQQEKHFCSLECLRLWIPKHPVASEFIAGADDVQVTYSDRVY